MLAAFVALLVATAPAASAAPSCAQQVIDDWWNDGRIDGSYADHCYDDAIESLPRDVRDYSSAQEDIERALQNKLRGEPAPPARTDPTPDDEPGETTGTPPTASPGDAPPDGGAQDPTASPSAGESATSVPIPLLILAGLALLLVMGGSAGYLVRRLQSRRLPPPAV